MDSYHRHLYHSDVRTGRDCEFCAKLDPDFLKRNPVDRWVRDKNDCATSHLSENGHIRHRIFEIAAKRAQQGMDTKRDFVGKTA